LLIMVIGWASPPITIISKARHRCDDKGGLHEDQLFQGI
jgi:hypothetical protein